MNQDFVPSRREFLLQSAALSSLVLLDLRQLIAEEVADIHHIRDKTLRYIESMRFVEGTYGRYRYAADCTEPTLYSSTYAAMTRHLYGDLETLTDSRRADWIAYLQSHQDDDGLFRDPVIFDQAMYKGDPEWCGRRHLSCHAVTALTALGAVAKKPFKDLERFLEPGALAAWLAARDWNAQPDVAGNEVLNVGTLLQYARDFQKEERFRDLVTELLDWMSNHHLSDKTALWGNLDLNDPLGHSRAVQGAYHFWLLYFYDHVPIPYAERAIDMCLQTQNKLGGFGQGVHSGDPLRSSACEDIDSIDPLARLFQTTDYRRADIQLSLERGLAAVLSNQTPDGGFWFVRDQSFTYGHPQLAASATQGAMFPTWFRTLALAYLAQALPNSSVAKFPWKFCNCPGIQFWMPRAISKIK